MKQYLLLPAFLLATGISQAQYNFTCIDINPNGHSSPNYIKVCNNTLYFAASAPGTGYEPYTSDGTAAGTKLLKDLSPGADSSAFADFVAYNGNVLFSAGDRYDGIHLWSTDGTDAGTQLVKKLTDVANSTISGTFTPFSGKMAFWVRESFPLEPYITDGTTTGTHRIADINPTTNSSINTAMFMPFDGKLYFMAYNTASGAELWSTDGTAAGTQMVRDIYPGSDGSGAIPLGEIGGKLILRASDPANGYELWETDGTTAGTKLLIDINPGTGNGVISINAAVAYKGKLYFAGNNGSSGTELWATDGTAAGTQMVKDINSGANGSSLLDEWLIYNGKLYFSAFVGSTGMELWETDGTTAGTKMVKDIFPGNFASSPRSLIAYNGKMFFTALEGTDGRQLFVSDGTEAGTKMIQPGLAPNTSPIVNSGLYLYKNAIYYAANYDNKGRELWIMRDATASVTDAPVDDVLNIYPNPSTGNVTIKADNTLKQNGTVHIYDMMGKVVYTSLAEKGSSAIQLQLGHLMDGIYHVKLTTEGITTTGKLTIQ